MPRILLLGDFAFDNEATSLRFNYKMENVDLVLMNLETPFPAYLEARPKAGPNLAGSSEALSQVGTRDFVLTLANNHIMDYGLPGLNSTLKFLNEMGFRSCGAGDTIHNAREPILLEIKGVQIGIIACCEGQFGVARRNQGGVAEFGPWVYQAIRDLRKTVDVVIVSVHAAVEDSPWPSPYIQELYHSFIDTGAAIVHGHHAHVPQGYEAYGNGVIFYGMGNFAVDPEKWQNYPNGMWSLAAEIDLSSIPVRWCPLTFEIRRESGANTTVIEQSSSEEQVSHSRYLETCNHPFDNPYLFEALWHEVALRVYYHHGAEYMRFSASSQNERRMHVGARLSMFKSALLNRVAVSSPSQHDYLIWYHMIACESHRQMLATALGIVAGEIKEKRTDESRRLADEMMPWSRGVIPV